MKTFVQGPELYLASMGADLVGFLNPDRPAILDADHRITVNYETFFFADEVGAKRFEQDIVRHRGPLTDPITRQRFVPTRYSPRLDHEGRAFFFVSDSSQNAFAAMPEMYALPNYRMLPRKPDSLSQG